MNNLVIIPLIIPLLTGVTLIFFRKNVRLQRFVTIFSLLILAAVTVMLIHQVSVKGTQTLNLGGWEPPFGIVLVADMFALLLVLATVAVSISCLLYGFRTVGEEREKHYLYPFVHFMIAGVMGSFLTGDLFNLFVFFEVMLLASYILVSLGGTRGQLRESLKYVLINIVSSMFFLIAIGYLYAITGTLNFADLSVKIAESGQDGLITTVAIFILLVFALKAALLMYFWLPGAYAVPPTAISAIFAALLTKVGIYAIFRTFTLVFYHETVVTHQLIGWMGIITMILGGIGAVAYWDVRRILAYNVIIAVGFIVAGLAVFTEVALVGSIYYLIHDMIVKALLFLLGGVIIGLSGTNQLREMSGMIRNHAMLGWMFFLAAFALAGVPPLSGFIGKLMVLQGAIDQGFYVIAAIGLLTSLMVLYSVMKIFVNGFWGENQLSVEDERISTKGLLLPCAILATISVSLGLGVEWINVYVLQAAEGLNNPQLYIDAVMQNAD